MMTEYKIGYLSFFNHLPVLIFEALLIYGATFINFYGWVWIVITSIVFAATFIAVTININKVFGVSEDRLTVRIGQKNIKEYPFSTIKTIRKRKWNIDIGFKDENKGKIKTIYIGWYIRRYKKMRDQLFLNVEKTDNYDRIIFID